MRLVLSLFPGVGLLDRAFEDAGFCVVRGPDLLFGGDVRRFDPPAGRFDGVIGGPPCQDFSAARRTEPTGNGLEMLAEFVRVVEAAKPEWWLLENVPRVPDVRIKGYGWQRFDLEQGWWSGVRRLRHIQFGHSASKGPSRLEIQRGTVHPDAEPAALACDDRPFAELCRLQGLPADFDLPGFTENEKKRAVGNGVPLLMGRKLAAAVLAAVYDETDSGAELPTFEAGRRSCSECGRSVTGRRVTCSARCRKVRSRRLSGDTVTVRTVTRGGVTDGDSVTWPSSSVTAVAAGNVVSGDAACSLAGSGVVVPAADIDAGGGGRSTVAAGTVDDGGTRGTADCDGMSSFDEVLTVVNDGAGLGEFLANGQYPGGKGAAGTAAWIIDHFPPHSLYVEPFAGSGAIARRKHPALRTLLVDLDPVTVNWWRESGSDLCPGATIAHGDGLAWLRSHLQELPSDALVYFDPPYMLARECDQPYNCRFSDDQHRELLEIVQQLPCFVCVSGYETPLYLSCLQERQGWRWSTREVSTRWGGRKNEFLWYNFDRETEQGFDVRNPGADYRDRERIKRKSERWAENVAALPAAERASVVSAVIRRSAECDSSRFPA